MKYENKCSEDRHRNIDFIAYSYEACTAVTWCVMKSIMRLFCWGVRQGDFINILQHISQPIKSFCSLTHGITFLSEMVQKLSLSIEKH